jgi:hypothetical protein
VGVRLIAMRVALCLLLIAGCAAEPGVATDELALHDQPLSACRAACRAAERAQCPDWVELPEAGVDTCLLICRYEAIDNPACEDEYVNLQLCRLWSPAPVYVCREDGEPHLRDRPRCQAQERALAACGEHVPES